MTDDEQDLRQWLDDFPLSLGDLCPGCGHKLSEHRPPRNGPQCWTCAPDVCTAKIAASWRVVDLARGPEVRFAVDTGDLEDGAR